jgi:hypothetical protein
VKARRFAVTAASSGETMNRKGCRSSWQRAANAFPSALSEAAYMRRASSPLRVTPSRLRYAMCLASGAATKLLPRWRTIRAMITTRRACDREESVSAADGLARTSPETCLRELGRTRFRYGRPS